MNATDVVNHFINNPPFEIADVAKYTEFVTFVLNYTLIELSENSDYIDEVKFTTAAPVNPDDTVVFHDLSTIHERFMELIVLEPVQTFPESIYLAVNSSTNGYSGVSTEALQMAMNNFSVVSYLSVKSYVNVIQKWFMTKVKKIIFKKSLVKLMPLTEYYALFRCYKSIDDVSMSELKIFKQLFEINLHLHIYQSDIFSSEGGLRSVSLSGLSVSFNVPDAQNKVVTLSKQKDAVLSTIALDYDDMIGLI